MKFIASDHQVYSSYPTLQQEDAMLTEIINNMRSLFRLGTNQKNKLHQAP